MRAWRKWILLLIGLIVVGTVVWNATRESRAVDPEPVYQGKPLSAWVINYATNTQITFKFQNRRYFDPADPAAVAIREIGTNAIPSMLKWAADVPSDWRINAGRRMARLPRPLNSLGSFTRDADSRQRALKLGVVLAFPKFGVAITNYYDYPDPLVRQGATNVAQMWAIDPDQLTSVPTEQSDALGRPGATNSSLDHSPGLLTNGPPR